jgi:hypothetical protein
MPMIFVRTKTGRVALDGPHGRLIPTDKFVPVDLTPWVDRLLNHHRDIELEKKPVVKPVDDAPEKAKKTDNALAAKKD